MIEKKQLPRLIVSLALLGIFAADMGNAFNQSLAALVGFYWLGSSAGSFNKDERAVSRSK